MTNELNKLNLVRTWNFLQGLRRLCLGKTDPLSAFLFYRATEDLKFLVKVIHARRETAFEATDDWAALTAAVDFFQDSDLPCFTTPDYEKMFNLQFQAFAAGFQAGCQVS